MILINFAHPLTPEQLERVRGWTGQEIEVRSQLAQFDPGRPMSEQAQALVDQIGLTPDEWQTLPLLVNPPAHHVFALAVVAELHGRIGYFPSILRNRPVANALTPQFEAAEILNLQSIRDAARIRR